MIIEDIFKKDINRNIKGVIKVDQDDYADIYQDLSEYVVTKELNKHFNEFFSAYQYSIDNPTDDIGVWISGFFGSGKSHFLKILSYLLDSNLIVDGKRPIDFFKEDNKIKDPIVLANMENAINVPTDVVLFNIDVKNTESNDEKDSILKVFYNVFNGSRGYCEEVPYIAELEEKLDDKGKYDDFKVEFEKVNGGTWENSRNDSIFIQDEIVDALVAIDFMSREAAEKWCDNADDMYGKSIENFASDVKKYLDKKGDNHRIVFLIDEVGQYIGDNTKLMLNLQSITEELGSKCHGRAWIIVTSQESIDEITKVKGDDFSKIQGRFKTRISLSSSNVDEVIKKRILEKTDTARDTLIATYENKESLIKNLLTFNNQAELKLYEDKIDFTNVYPFIPYQFILVQKVLNSIRMHGATGKHLAEGERSMLSLFQESAQIIEKNEVGTLISFDLFYNPLEQFIDNNHSRVINNAIENTHLDEFDVKVLKVLFMIKYVKEIKGNVDNITTLLIDNTSIIRLPLKEKVTKSLDKLIGETLVQKNGDIYEFLTDEEQDINREIKQIQIEEAEILEELSNIIFEDVIKENKYSYNKRYNFNYSQYIDNKRFSRKEEDIGLRFITSYYSLSNDMSVLVDISDEQNLDTHLREKSKSNKETIFKLHDDEIILTEIEERLQILRYLKKKGSENSNNKTKTLLQVKSQEAEEKRKRVETFVEHSIEIADIYIAGNHEKKIDAKNPNERINDALGKLVNKTYNKLSYMTTEPDKNDIKDVLEENLGNIIEYKETDNINAFEDLKDYITRESEIHNKPSMKSILIRYRKAPYGFIDLDIQWLIAKLYSTKSISLSKNGEIITRTNTSNSELFKYLTDNQFSDKIIIDKKETISKTSIKIAKDILNELFNETIQTNDADILKEKIEQKSKEKLNKVKQYLSNYGGDYNYPGEEILKVNENYLYDIQSKKDNRSFFNFLKNNEEDILEYNEELESIETFFDGNQSKFFREATDIYKIYDKNKYLINNNSLDDVAKQINDILKMPNPQKRIPELPELRDTIKKGLNLRLDEEKNKIKPILKEDEEDLLKELNNDDLKEEFENSIKTVYGDLYSKLDRNNDISSISGVKDQSANIKSKFEEDILKFNNIENGNPEKPKIESVYLSSLINQPRISISNSEDLEEFINTIKSNLEKKLEENEKIYINK